MDGLRIITPSSVLLLRQNHSRALIIPSHLQLAKRYSLYPDFFIHIYDEFQKGNESVTQEYAEIPADMFIAVIQQLLSVRVFALFYALVLRVGQLQSSNPRASLRAEARHPLAAQAVADPFPVQRAVLHLLQREGPQQSPAGCFCVSF